MQEIKAETFCGFTTNQMTPETKPHETLNEIKQYLPEKWWISAGTALWLYRDGDWFGENADVDIGVISNEILVIPGLTEFRRTTWRGRVMQQAFKDKRNVIFDIFHYYTDVIPNKLFAASELGYIVKPLFDIKELPTKYGNLPFLNPIEDYLTDRYGDWKTPSGFKGNHITRLDI